MPAHSGSTFNRPSSSPTPGAIRSLRRLLLVAGSVYLAWWFLVEALLPGSYNPLLGRLVVVLSFFAALAASFHSSAIRRHLPFVFAACAWLLTAHYYYLLHRNHGDMPWAVGAYIVVVAVSACISSQIGLLAYSLLSVALGFAASLVDRPLLHTIFLPGLATMTLLSNLTLQSRLLLERGRIERARIDDARLAAEAGVALRDEFISVASHELRTPLAALLLAVQGLARTVHRAHGPPSADALERSLEVCERQTSRLTNLVERLLDGSQIAAGRLALRTETVSLVDIVRDVAQALETEAAGRGSSIEIAGDPAVRGSWDRVRIEQVVSHLLRNALAFGLGRPIRVAVTAEGKAARLSVADEGIGIARAEQSRIFARFERAVSTKNYGGFGLGLYVVSQIVEAHAGRIRVESELGSGATFTVELPLTAEQTAGPARFDPCAAILP